MTQDAILRTVAVAAAVALVAAPHYRLIFEKLTAATAAAKAHGAELARIAAALLIVAAMWGKVPLPDLSPIAPVSPAIVVPEPTPALRTVVEPVREALAGLSPADRDLWASTWSKAALVVEAEGSTAVPVFTDTPSLRAFTVIALDVAWRRIGGHAPGGVDGLRTAVEAAMRSVVGLDSVPATADTRARYAEAARAIAWAGTR